MDPVEPVADVAADPSAGAFCPEITAALDVEKPGHQVERSFKTRGEATITLNLSTGAWTKTQSGVATHAGQYTGAGEGYATPNGGSGSGTVTVANGDEVFWTVELKPLVFNPATGAATIEGTITWTGGTGRFENASGSAQIVYQGQMVVAENGIATLTMSYTATGTLKYSASDTSEKLS